MLEIKLFDGGMKGVEVTLLHSVWIDGRIVTVRCERCRWSSICTSGNGPASERKNLPTKAPGALIHDWEEVAAHA